MGSPSTWSHRALVAALALAGCGLSLYLTLYQWHVTGAVWDPIFGSMSSESVLHSAVSRALPIPDATLGAMAYVVEASLALAGGPDRWWRRAWLVLLFGLVAAVLALIGLALVLTQIFVVRALCTLCLCSAGISFINAWLARREAFATLSYLQRGRRDGAPIWQLLRGGAQSGADSPSGRAA